MSRSVIINIVGKYYPNDIAKKFYDCASKAVEAAGFKLRFSVLSDHD